MSATPPNIVLSPASYEDVRRVQLGLGCSETLAWVLVRRGVTDVAAARTLLEPIDVDDASHYGDPFLLGDMAAAVERIRFAIDDEQPIVVHGDYDADGVCSTTLLVEALEALGAHVRAFLPSRFEHGYGLAIETAELLARDGARLLITVDCGITAIESIQHALDLGLDTIVLDHHQPGEQLPPAIICSTRPSNYPEPDMCATAVAGKLAQALGAPYGDSAHELEAIATIADCMPLTGENRAFVRRGLRALKRTQRPGLRALLSACDTHPSDADEETIGFRVAPRINAVGRLEHPDLAYELLRAGDAATAERSARNLHDINDRRRQIEAQIVEQAHAQVATFSDAERAHRIWVLSGTDWHEGVVGIVASRMVERYQRPVIVLGVSGALARGSGRSVDGVNLHAAIESARELIVRGGGHAAAVGITVDPGQLGALRSALATWASEHVLDEHMQPQLRADAVLAPDDLGVALVEEISRLAPFGTGNERPVLFVPAATALDAKAIGADKTHLRCRFELADGTSAPVIAFGQAALIADLAITTRVDACVTVGMNRFRGSETLQLTAQSIRTVPDALPDVDAGECATDCSITCDDRLPISDLIQLAVADAAGAPSAGGEPALEPLLAHTHAIDLRHTGRGAAHIARLLTAGHSVLLVVADVSRRRELLTTSLQPYRLGAGAAVLSSTRCSPVVAQARLRRALSATTSPVLALVDHASAAGVIADNPGRFTDVVIYDPPVTESDRTALLTIDLPLHLTFGAAEARFSRDAARAIADVRGTLGTAWKPLRNGIEGPADLDRLLWGGAHGSHLHSAAAVTHALGELTRRGLIKLDATAATVSVRELAVAAE